jgi:hypothetical protein
VNVGGVVLGVLVVAVEDGDAGVVAVQDEVAVSLMMV